MVKKVVERHRLDLRHDLAMVSDLGLVGSQEMEIQKKIFASIHYHSIGN